MRLLFGLLRCMVALPFLFLGVVLICVSSPKSVSVTSKVSTCRGVE